MQNIKTAVKDCFPNRLFNHLKKNVLKDTQTNGRTAFVQHNATRCFLKFCHKLRALHDESFVDALTDERFAF